MFSEAKPYKSGFTVHPFPFHPRIFSLSQSGGKSIELQIQHFARSCTNPRHIPLRAGVQGLCGCLAIRRGKARPELCAFFLQRMGDGFILYGFYHKIVQRNRQFVRLPAKAEGQASLCVCIDKQHLPARLCQPYAQGWRRSSFWLCRPSGWQD